MNKGIEMFNSLMQNPDPSLYDRVVFAVNREERKMATIKVSIFSVLSFVSVSGFLWSFKYLFESMASSGFSQFLSLVFSDGFSVLKYAGDYILSMTDSLPIVALLLFLVVTLMAVISVSYMISGLRQVRNVRRVLA